MLKFYTESEQKSQQFVRIMIYYAIFNQMTFLGTLGFSIYFIIAGTFDASALSLPMNLVVPFNTETILGWYTLWLIEFNMGLAYILPMTSITSYFVSCCCYIVAVCNHFSCLIESIKKNLKHNRMEKNPLTRQRNDRKMTKQFVRAIEMHMNAFE